MAYASGKYAYGMCDRCGFRYYLSELRKEWNGLKTCPECFETKQPQLEPNPHVADPEALYQPRPDLDIEAGQGRVYTVNNSDVDPNQDVIGSAFDGLKGTGETGDLTIST